MGNNKSRILPVVLGMILLVVALIVLIANDVFTLAFSFTTAGSWMLFIWFLLSILFFFAFLGIMARIGFLAGLAKGWFLAIYLIFSLFVIINVWWQVVPLEKVAEVKKVTKVEEGVITVPGEIAVLAGAGEWTKAGPSGRKGAHGGGELYLGDGGASGTYEVKIDDPGEYTFWIRTSDDALHSVGSRAVTIKVNEQEDSWTDTGESYPWKWFKIKDFEFAKGENTVVITKNKQTPAAFIMDEFILAKDPNYLPE